MLAMLICAGCGEGPVVGNMNSRDICRASESLILQRLGENFSGNENSDCNVQPVDERYAQIYSYYTDPEGLTHHYAARAVVNDETLRVYEIRVENVDEIFLPFRFFPAREF